MSDEFGGIDVEEYAGDEEPARDEAAAERFIGFPLLVIMTGRNPE